jgi:hypothetical protein
LSYHNFRVLFFFPIRRVINKIYPPKPHSDILDSTHKPLVMDTIKV